MFFSTLLALAAVTLIFSLVEKGDLMQTTGRDDIASHPPIGLVQKKTKIMGDEWIVRQPGMLKSQVPVKKKKDAFRIGCVGGSFMMGFPYTQDSMISPGYAGIPHWLQMDLSLRYPSRTFDVVNLGAAGQNSARVVQIVRDIMPIVPDLLIVATGNNEGGLGPSRIGKALHKWIVYRVLKKAILPATDMDKRPLFTLQDPDVQKIEEEYRKNISKIIATCKQNKTPLLFVTLPINLRYEYSKHKAPKSWEQDGPDDPVIKIAKAHIKNCEFEKAIEALSQPGTHVYSLYLLGVCNEMLGEFGKAREAYRMFAQNVPMNRARPSFNQFVRSSAAKNDFYLVDLERILDDFSPYHIPDVALFIDYCHMKWWANQMMAGKIADRIVEKKLVLANPEEPFFAPTLKRITQTFKLEALFDLDESKGAAQFLVPWEKGEGRFPLSHPNPIVPLECVSSGLTKETL